MGINNQADTAAELLGQAGDVERRREAWIVDEASMLSARDSEALLSHAREAEARLILVGDVRQPGSVEAGRAFGQLQEHRMSRATNTIFSGIVAAIWQDWMIDQPSELQSEELLWTERVGRIPAFVFDGHTAKGSRYLSRLAELDRELAWWLCSNLPPSLRKPALKKFCFRTISAQCNQRHSWEPAEKVRAQAGSVGFRLSKQSFLEGLSVFRAASANYPIWEIG